MVNLNPNAASLVCLLRCACDFTVAGFMGSIFGYVTPRVAIIMGSDSDLHTMKGAAVILETFDIPYEKLFEPEQHADPLESCTNSTDSYVIYAPVDVVAMNVVLNGGDPDYVALLPSG